MSYKFENYSVKIFYDSRDHEFGAFIEEIPDISAYGVSQAGALAALHSVFDEWLEIALEKQLAIPSPLSSDEYSGRFVLRIPKSLHRTLAEKAKQDNVSLNQEALYCLTRGMRAS